jgi:hypothetical protein
MPLVPLVPLLPLEPLLPLVPLVPLVPLLLEAWGMLTSEDPEHATTRATTSAPPTANDKVLLMRVLAHRTS